MRYGPCVIRHRTGFVRPAGRNEAEGYGRYSNDLNKAGIDLSEREAGKSMAHLTDWVGGRSDKKRMPEETRGDTRLRTSDSGRTPRAEGGRVEGFQPRVLIFACNWCSYAGADLAGVSRVQMPPDCQVVRVMCSGRVEPELVISALCRGMDGVLVLGCHPGECHYTQGNYYARRRALLLKELLPYVGIEPERFQLKWVSASEGGKFAEVVQEMVEGVRRLGPVGAEWG